jgi:transcriptional regulator with XRE-family HTH domain
VQDRLGKTIRILRQAKGLKVSDLADKAEISVSFLSLVENNQRQPSLDVIRRISKALGIPPEALVLMGMGSQTSLSTKNEASAEITETVERLMEIESRLGKLLSTEAHRGKKTRNARAHRPSDGNKPK